MGLETATTIRSLLMRAWRERWTDVQWGIHLKTVLPRYISGDIYHLSECLLQQALMGSLPNKLILSYLTHSLSSGMVSYSAVIESISKFNSYNKLYCVQALLELMKILMRNAYSRGKPEDCLALATSILSGTNWLVRIMVNCVEKIHEKYKGETVFLNLELAVSVIEEMLHRPFLMCMLHLGCREESNVWVECCQSIAQLEQNLAGAGRENVLEQYIRTVVQLRNENPYTSLKREATYNSVEQPVCVAVYTMATLEAMVHTTRDSHVFAKQLLLVKSFKGMSTSDLYLELFKSCMFGLGADEVMPYQELKWVGFTYIKVPSIVNTIHRMIHGESAPSFSQDLHRAVERLSRMTPLLDVADSRVNCNCLEYLLKEFTPKSGGPSYDLLEERDALTILAHRMQESKFLGELQKRESQGACPGNPDLILRAQPTVVSILKTLSSKNTDSVLPVLSLLISGKSRELLLVAAASSGNLHIYAQKFVKLNEQSKNAVPGETSKSAMTRAVVFDISFLLLCHIAQIYGSEVVVSEEKSTFVEKWILENIPESGKLQNIHKGDKNKAASVAAFKKHMATSEADKYIGCCWSDIFEGASICISEIVQLASHSEVSAKMVFDLLIKQNEQLCSLSVCIAAWLCSLIQIDDANSPEALNYLSFMRTKMVGESSPHPGLDNFKDRSNMMCEVVENMMDVLESDQSSNAPMSMNLSDDKENLEDRFNETWQTLKDNSGLITHDVLKQCQHMLRLGGSNWFVSSFIKVALEKTFERELSHAVDMICSLFQINIVQCTTSFLLYTLPSYLIGPLSAELKSEPRTNSLAVLTAKLMVSCWLHVQPPPVTKEIVPFSTTMKSLKRPLEETESFALDNLIDRIPAVASMNMGSDGVTFLGAVNDVFRIMLTGSRWEAQSPVTHLMVTTLRELASLPHSSGLLTLLPVYTLNGFLPILPASLSFTHSELLVLGAPEPGKGPQYDEKAVVLQGDLSLHAHCKTKTMRQTTAKLLCIKRNLELSWASDHNTSLI